jgi:polyhydroxybutyrate depolymerase
MIRRLTSTLLFCLLAFISPAFAQESTPESTPAPEITDEPTPETTPLAELPGAGQFTIQQPYDGVTRVYRMIVPESYRDEGDGMPLVFVLHGAGGTGLGIAGFSGFNELAEREGFIVVYPDGLGGAWNDNRPDPRLQAIDDVGFLTYILDYLIDNLNVDANRVYTVGYSMGGMMSYRLGCEARDRFAAVASVASTMPEYLINLCDEVRPLPVLVIQGTDDNVVPWVGYRGGYLSARDTLRHWGALNGCTEQAPTMETLPDINPEDGTLVVLETHPDCEGNSEVALYGVHNGGHTWPGRAIQAPFDLGLTTRDFEASEAIWEFFSRHAL